MTHPPAPDSPHKAVTLPGDSSRVKSSNTTCGTRQHASLEEKKREGGRGGREGGGRGGREGGGRGEREGGGKGGGRRRGGREEGGRRKDRKGDEVLSPALV